jgi:hypothetical protein
MGESGLTLASSSSIKEDSIAVEIHRGRQGTLGTRKAIFTSVFFKFVEAHGRKAELFIGFAGTFLAVAVSSR